MTNPPKVSKTPRKTGLSPDLGEVQNSASKKASNIKIPVAPKEPPVPNRDITTSPMIPKNEVIREEYYDDSKVLVKSKMK